MQRTMLKSKIYRATVTDSDLHYVGSITVDPDNKIINLDHEVATLLGTDRPHSSPVDQPALAAANRSAIGAPSKGAI